MTLHSSQAPAVPLRPDILMEIFSHLQPGRCSQEDRNAARKRRRVCRQALLASALTCRTFSDLALDVLWRALDDIQPLLKLLPGYKRPFVLKPYIAPETWKKFQSYATRIRETGLFLDRERVHPSVWTFLVIKCENFPLLPRLYDLDVYDLLLDELSPLFLLLTPSLRSLSLSFAEDRGKDRHDSQVTVLVLQHIARVSPRIKTFQMSGCHCFTSGTHLSMLQTFAGLTELSLDSDEYGFDGAMLCQLSTTTSFKALAIIITSSDPSSLQPLRDNFRLLHRLTLKGRLEDLVNLILACRLPVLNALTLQVEDCDTPLQLIPELVPLCQHPDLAKSLTHIGIDFLSGITAQRFETLSQYLGPLLSFRKVERCDLNFRNTAPSVCDDDLIRLADAWPGLQHLNIRGCATVHNDNWNDWNRRGRYGDAWSCDSAPDIQHPTVLGLTELARRSPALRYVHLVTLDIKIPASMPSRTAAYPRLRELLCEHVHNARLSARWRCAVAELLGAAFPRLDVSRSKAECAYPNIRADWRRIMLLVGAVQYRDNPGIVVGGAGTRVAAAAKIGAERGLIALDKSLEDGEDGDSDEAWYPGEDEDEDEEVH
ncbi:hypothetical protein V8D89_008354 [Ganoderma adspersum]